MAPAEVIQDLTSLKSALSDTKGDPPAYGVHPQDTHLPTFTSAAVDLFQLKPNTTNFFYMDGYYRNIKRGVTIDPSLRIPEAYLPPLQDINVDAAGERMNMYVHTGEDLDLDVRILGRKDSDVALDPMKRTRMHVGSRNGSVTVKVNAIGNIHPFSLDLVSRDKPITVFIPRSFHGTVTFTAPGKCALSDEMMTNSTLLGAVDNKRTYFVGDLAPVVFGSGTGLAEWVPDELRVVTIKYVDEVKPAVSKWDEAKSVVAKQDEVESLISKRDETKSVLVAKQDEVKSVVSKRRFLGCRLFHTHS